MIPYRNETKEQYAQRMKDMHLHVAMTHHKLNNKRSMYLALLYWAMAEEFYADHWLFTQRINK